METANNKNKTGNQDLRKLKRPDLLEIMLAQSREIDMLREELQQEKQKNREQEELLEKAGDIEKMLAEVKDALAEIRRAQAGYAGFSRKNQEGEPAFTGQNLPVDGE